MLRLVGEKFASPFDFKHCRTVELHTKENLVRQYSYIFVGCFLGIFVKSFSRMYPLYKLKIKYYTQKLCLDNNFEQCVQRTVALWKMSIIFLIVASYGRLAPVKMYVFLFVFGHLSSQDHTTHIKYFDTFDGYRLRLHVLINQRDHIILFRLRVYHTVPLVSNIICSLHTVTLI